jgi:CCR4-NOT transcription complex subunit 2
MTPAGAKPIPANPVRFNLLARPITTSTACHVCNLPGHSSPSIKSTAACRNALLSLITFWQDTISHVSSLYSSSERFKAAIVANKPSYEMRLDNGGVKGGDIEVVIVEKLTRSWLKFVSHVARIRARVNMILDEEEVGRLGEMERMGNGFLMDGMTCKFTSEVGCRVNANVGVVLDLFERSVAEKQ